MKDKPVPPPKKTELPSWAEQFRALAEARKWPDEDELSGIRNKNDARWLTCYGWLVVAATVFFTVLFVLSLGAWSWHYLAPVSWAWLTPDQLSKIQSVIFSGSLGAIVASIMKRQIDK